jgi:hypothetical protein
MVHGKNNYIISFANDYLGRFYSLRLGLGANFYVLAEDTTSPQGVTIELCPHATYPPVDSARAGEHVTTYTVANIRVRVIKNAVSVTNPNSNLNSNFHFNDALVNLG